MDVFGHDDIGLQFESVLRLCLEDDGLEAVAELWGAEEGLAAEAADGDEVNAGATSTKLLNLLVVTRR